MSIERLKTVLLGLVAGAIAGCSASDATGVGGPSVSKPNEDLVLTLSVEHDTLVPGATRLLVARVTNKAGAPRLAPIAWSSSNPEVASVSGGTVTAVGTGEALVIARAGVVADTATIVVPAVELQLSPSAVIATAGDTVRFRAAFVGTGIDADAPGVSWAVSDTNLAQVQGSLLLARSEGDVQLSATAAGFVARAAVRIRAARIASLTVVPAVASVSVGGTVDFDVIARDERGRVIAGADVEWYTSDPSIATIDSRGRARALSRGGVIVGARANGRVATAALNVSSEPASGLLLQLPATQIAVGQRIQATATPLDASGNPLPGRPIAWQSSNPAVATVNSLGLITGIAPGNTTISAMSDGRVASQVLAVVVPTPTNVVVIPEMARLTRGSRTRLAAEVRDQLGNVISSASVNWSSMNPAVATVSSAGEVTALGEGTAMIRAASGSLADTAVVAVEGTPVASVRVSPSSLSLLPGQQQAVSAVALDASGNQLSDRPVSWTSSNPEIATVSNAGVITAIAVGTALVTATIEGKTASVSVTVSAPPPAPVAAVVVTLSSGSVLVGQSVQATARVLDAQGNELTGRPVTWSSANPTVATVNASGVVTAVSAGSATIVAQREGVQGYAVLNVAPPPPAPVASIELTVPRSELALGDSMVLGVTLRDAAGNVLSGRTVAFSSSPQSVASVSVDGVVTGRAEGSATITATSEGVSRSVGINVRSPVGYVSVTLSASTLLPGQGTQAQALVLSPSGTPLSGRVVTWSSSNTAVATVNASGYVTAVAAGSAQITATSEGKSGSATLTVQAPPAPVASVSVTLGTSTLAPGQGTQATVVLRDASGNVLTGRSVTWSSSNTAVATVNASGYVTAVAAGSAQITAISEGKSGSATLAVQAPSSPVASVSVTLGQSTLQVGQGTQAQATILDATGHPVSGQSVTWSSSNTAVATVNASGYVTAVAAGTAQIVASAGGKSGSAPLTVQSAAPAPVATVTVTLSASTLQPGQGTQASAVLRDASGNVLTGRSVSWSSSNTAVATVNASGYVTAVAAGTAQITATSEGKSGSATLTVESAPPPSPPPSGIAQPALPRTIDFPYPQVTGVTRTVSAGQDLQAVLNQAQRGDEIVLQAGARWTGNYVLPAKPGSGWIIIRSSNLSSLPAGVRVTPAQASLMPKIRTSNSDPALRTATGARGWYIAGVEIELDPAFNQYANYGIVRLEQAGRIVLDRVYIHGGTNTPTQRCLALNSDSTVVADSYLAECHGRGYDSQAIGGWDGPGPFKIVNNTLMGAGENVMFGGAGSSSDATRPRDVEFRRNYVYKPASWKGVWTVKNLLELKNVERILIEGNVFDGSWQDAQVGFAFVFMSEDETTWSGTTDVTVRYNIIRNAGAGINIWPHAGSRPIREPVSRVLVEHNVMENIRTGIYDGDGKLLQILGDADPAYTASDIQFRYNTFTGSNSHAIVVTQYSARNFVLTNNVFTRGTYGFFRDGGLPFAGAFSGSVTLSPNVIVPDAGGMSWPNGTLFASSVGSVPSGYGANTSMVQSATSGVVIP